MGGDRGKKIPSHSNDLNPNLLITPFACMDPNLLIGQLTHDTINIQKRVVTYTGDVDSRNSGCNLCSSIPQKGHNGFESSSSLEDSVEILKSEG